MKTLSFKEAFRYPFNRWVGMFNILWILIPIIGWFALVGYNIRIIQRFIQNDFKELPIFKFGENLRLGFKMFLKVIPFVIVYMLVIGVSTKIIVNVGEILLAKERTINLTISLVNIIIGIFVIPVLAMNFFNKETVTSFFELKIIKSVFSNLGGYIMALLKSITLALTFLPMCIVPVGIPAGGFTKNIFLADFYRRRIKNIQ